MRNVRKESALILCLSLGMLASCGVGTQAVSDLGSEITSQGQAVGQTASEYVGVLRNTRIGTNRLNAANGDDDFQLWAADLDLGDSIDPIYYVANTPSGATAGLLAFKGMPTTGFDFFSLSGDPAAYVSSYSDCCANITTSFGSAVIDSKSCAGFRYNKLAAKEMTENLYLAAYYYDSANSKYVYSAPVKHGALKYCYDRQNDDSGNTSAKQKAMSTAVLAYGAAAQTFFDETDRMADAPYHKVTTSGGTLADGFTSGLYHGGYTADEVQYGAEKVSLGSSDWCKLENNAYASVNGSTIEMPDSDLVLYKDNSRSATGGSSTSVESGDTIYGTVSSDGSGSTATVNGGTVNGEIKAENDGTVNVYGGTVNGEVKAENGGNAYVEGGTVNGDVTAGDDGTVKIVSGGTLNGSVTVGEGGTFLLGKSTMTGNVTVADGGIFNSTIGTINGNINVGENATVYFYGGTYKGTITINYGTKATIQNGDFREVTSFVSNGSVVVQSGLFNFDPSDKAGFKIDESSKLVTVYKDDDSSTVDYYRVKNYLEIEEEEGGSSKGGGVVVIPEDMPMF